MENGRTQTVSPGDLCIAIIMIFHLGFSFFTSRPFIVLIRYTDIDYSVFSDAAKQVWSGGSPFDRATYRYTPLMAWMCIPNIFFSPSGKIVFATFDLAVGLILRQILMKQGIEKKRATAHAGIWLFCPFTAVASTRGSADSIVCALVLVTLLLFLDKKYSLAAIMLGLCVHVKLYPVIFGIPMYLALDSESEKESNRSRKSGISQNGTRSEGSHEHGGSNLRDYLRERKESYVLIYWIQKQLKWSKLKFAFLSLGTFLVLTGFFYILYGPASLYEGLIYHFVRKDTRHNFSIYFLSTYYDTLPLAQKVRSNINPDQHSNGLLREDSDLSRERISQYWVNGMHYHKEDDSAAPYVVSLLVAQFPALMQAINVSTKPAVLQMFGVLSIGFMTYGNLTACMFFQTMYFVFMNTVVTAQYFCWWISLLPLITPFIDLSAVFHNFPGKLVRSYGPIKKVSQTLVASVVLVFVWLIGELGWLFQGYRLEIKGDSAFIGMWVAGIIFWLTNIFVFVCLFYTYPWKPLSPVATLKSKTK